MRPSEKLKNSETDDRIAGVGRSVTGHLVFHFMMMFVVSE